MSSGLGARTHTRSSWWFLPTGEQSSAQERPVANRRARRAQTSRYAHTSPSMWVSDRATRSGGKRRGRASGCFSPGLARLEPAITSRWVNFETHFLALLALFLASSFHGPFFWLCHILGLWWAVSVWVDEGWGSEAIRRQTNSPGSVFTLLCSPAYTISLQIWWAFNLRLIISENSNLVTWKATSDCHLCFEELAKYPIWEASVGHEEFFSRIKIYLTPCKFLCRVSSSVINTAESEFFSIKVQSL